MRYAALADLASRTYARDYESDARFRHNRRQSFVAEEIAALPNIKKILIAAEELMEAA